MFKYKSSKILLNYFKIIDFNKSYYNLYLLYSNFILFYSFLIKSSFVFFCKIINFSEVLTTRFIIGICLSVKRKKGPFSVKLRNSFKGDYVEFIIFLLSPFLLDFKILNKYFKKYRLSRLYFLRSKSLKNFFI